MAKEWTGDDVVVEMTPFRFDDERKRTSFLEIPWGYVADLTNHVLGYLNALDEYVYCILFEKYIFYLKLH